MKKKSKKIFADNSSWTFDKNVAHNFDYHIEKSVPLYNEFKWLGEKLSDYYLKEDSTVYDIGCSTGSFLKRLAIRHDNKKKLKLHGIDIVKNMINFAKKNNKHKKITYQNKDILKYNFKKSDFFISFYTIQFIHPKHRQLLINKIYKKLNWGGAFLFLEKVRSYDARTQDQLTNIYEEFKIDNKFSLKEIINKKLSLKGVLEPFSTKANLQMLKRAGFEDVSTVAKFACFEFFLAIK
jgi:tRNA (cmo5U34)-methyltransferase